MPRPDVEGIEYRHVVALTGAEHEQAAYELVTNDIPALLDYVRELEAERIHHQVVVRRLVQWLDSLSGWLEEDQAATWDMFRARLVASDSFTPPTPA